jgi:hypothetical protein
MARVLEHPWVREGLPAAALAMNDECLGLGPHSHQSEEEVKGLVAVAAQRARQLHDQLQQGEASGGSAGKRWYAGAMEMVTSKVASTAMLLHEGQGGKKAGAREIGAGIAAAVVEVREEEEEQGAEGGLQPAVASAGRLGEVAAGVADVEAGATQCEVAGEETHEDGTWWLGVVRALAPVL